MQHLNQLAEMHYSLRSDKLWEVALRKSSTMVAVVLATNDGSKQTDSWAQSGKIQLWPSTHKKLPGMQATQIGLDCTGDTQWLFKVGMHCSAHCSTHLVMVEITAGSAYPIQMAEK